jgi:hypothetical protein
MNANNLNNQKSGNARVSGTSSIFANTGRPAAADSNPVAACFDGTTLVHTIHGFMEIGDIGVGVPVLSRNETTGEQGYRPVARTFVHDDRLMYRIDYVTENGDTDALSATPEHPFWVKGVGWTQVGHLKDGDVLEICDPSGQDDRQRAPGDRQKVALGGGRWVATVVSVSPEEDTLPVFNIEVDEFHTYFVGTFGVWVHNKGRVAGLSRSPLLRFPIRLNFLGLEKNQDLLLPLASDCAWSGAIAKDHQRQRC